MDHMFSGCTNLLTIYASDKFDVNSVSSSENMFTGSLLIVGGNCTKYDNHYIDKTYARMDTASYDETGNLVSGEPGYFTSK